MSKGTFETEDINEFRIFIKLMQKNGYTLKLKAHSILSKTYSTTFKKKL